MRSAAGVDRREQEWKVEPLCLFVSSWGRRRRHAEERRHKLLPLRAHPSHAPTTMDHRALKALKSAVRKTTRARLAALPQDVVLQESILNLSLAAQSFCKPVLTHPSLYLLQRATFSNVFSPCLNTSARAPSACTLACRRAKFPLPLLSRTCFALLESIAMSRGATATGW